MVSGQRRAGEVVKAPGARLAAIALPIRLGVVAPVADYRIAAAAGAAHALRPAVLAHEGEALGVVQQPREVDQVRCSHDGRSSSREPVGCSRSSHHTRCPPNALPRPTTPEPDKSLSGYAEPVEAVLLSCGSSTGSVVIVSVQSCAVRALPPWSHDPSAEHPESRSGIGSA